MQVAQGEKKVIATDLAPKPVGPYSQAVSVGPFTFCSGQIAIEPTTDEVLKVGVAEQTKKVMENIQGLLSAAGLTFEHIIKSTIFLTNMADFTEVNEVYSSYLKAPFPARSTVAVSGLPKGVQVEIEVVAYKHGG